MADKYNFTLKLRRDTARRWAMLNPVLAEGEPAFEKDTGRFKIGDGSKPYNDLEYFVTSEVEPTPDTSLQAHIWADEPHPVYDQGPSLLLLYENAKV